MAEYTAGYTHDDQLLTMAPALSTKRYVKGMVSLRCKMIMKEELKKASLTYSLSPHGGIEFSEETTEGQLEALNRKLQKAGLELLAPNDSMLVDRIINTVIEVIHFSDELPDLRFEDLIGSGRGMGGESILKIFSDVTGISIMQFIILQKIERAKELLLYDDLSLAAISTKLRYKNEHYFIAQFKKHTGLPPSYFKQLKAAK